VKERLQEKKRIGVLLSSLSSASVPLRLFIFRKPKIALLNLLANENLNKKLKTKGK